MRFIAFTFRRLVLLVPVMILVAMITFVASQLVPGDPASLLVAEGASSEEYQAIRRQLGLDRPIYEQAAVYLANVARGDLGTSIRLRKPVAADILRFLTGTVELGVVAFLLSLAIGVPLGIIAAYRINTWIDHVIRVFSLGGVAVPIFWSALVAQLLLYGQLGWLPGGGRYSETLMLQHPTPTVTGLLVFDAALAGQWVMVGDALRHLLLPAIVLAYPSLAIITRMTRSAMLDVWSQDYIRTARAFGFAERHILMGPAFRNAVPTILTIMGLALGHMLQGSILVETVFNWPGLGLYLYGGVTSLDYPVVTGVTLVFSLNYVLINLLVDIGYFVADPRLNQRQAGSAAGLGRFYAIP